MLIPTHRPHAGRLIRTLAALAKQTLPASEWETILIDNASTPPVDMNSVRSSAPENLSILQEPKLGLTHARKAGLQQARGELIVFVDDDNVLAPDYLEQSIRLMTTHPSVGLAGGKSLPEFEIRPQPWQQEFLPLLALRDYGDTTSITTTLRPPGSIHNEYPHHAPIGAGLVARREAFQPWLSKGHASITGRHGASLASGEDNDIVMCAVSSGWHTAYFPELFLTHLIPSGRLDAAYLARLNRGIQKSWMQVLSLHGANAWTPIASWTVPLRKIKAWFTYRAWSSPAARIRWQGACGHFEGRSR